MFTSCNTTAGPQDTIRSAIQLTEKERSNQVLTCLEGDNAIRWQPGEWLHHIFEQRVDCLAAREEDYFPAVDSLEGQCSYRQLDERANQLARWLKLQGVAAGDTIGLLFDKSVYSYMAMLAVSKIFAAYVPLDPAFPENRIAYIGADSRMTTILTLSCYISLTGESGLTPLCLDTSAPLINLQDKGRLAVEETGEPVSELSYIIYTSGTTGRPKGVPIEQQAICNFVRVAGEVYGYRPSDRVYQGLTLAFDFAVEEILVPLMVGATLVPNQTGASLLGCDLADFLRTHRITAMCCVPTLLATIDQDLPDLRLLIVSGEACPADLINRWTSPDRTILNAYGPTETTVTATLARAEADNRVTIGRPLPTYSVLILEPGSRKILPFGREGEIAIAGPGVARGYLNRPDQTCKAFIDDFLHLENNTSGLIYRSGDLGLINRDGNVEYRGRIDLQVKIRGYRIELTEIESVILKVPQVAQVVVETFEPVPGTRELVAYYTLHKDTDGFCQDDLIRLLRSKLPAYMVPSYYEQLEIMPMLASDKADRKALPVPSCRGMSSVNREFVEPQKGLETDIAEVLSEVLQLDNVSATEHFFDDLGANSLLMTCFCAELRKRKSDIDISMRDVYVQPTVVKLAASLSERRETEQQEIQVDEFRIPGRLEYYLCGACQLTAYLVFFCTMVIFSRSALSWVFSAANPVSLYLRSTALFSGTFFCWTGLAIAAKWILIGRWKAEKISIWGVKYFRLWLLKRILLFNPITLFKGYPLYNLYLRMLGARIGRNVVMDTKVSPLCTDLLIIGDNTILRRDSVLVSYKARSNYIYIAPVRLGSNVIVGEGSVVDIDTEMADDSQLAHASCLLAGQKIPAGKCYHGNPARETETDFSFPEQQRICRMRVVIFSLVQLLSYLLVIPPFVITMYFSLYEKMVSGNHTVFSAAWLGSISIKALLLFLSLQAAVLLLSVVVPRLLYGFLKEDKTYVLYGVHFCIFKTIQKISNNKMLTLLFGDSSYIIMYMKMVGYRFARIIQTGSNFGLEHTHDMPFLCYFGSGTMISDGFHLLNQLESSTAFRLQKTLLGSDNFVGNNVYYPVEGKTGNNCLIATKAMVPVDGDVRQNVGLLGSPCFEIPRSVERDKSIKRATRDNNRLSGLAGKNRHNLVTIALYLLSWFVYILAGLLVFSAAVHFNRVYGVSAWLLGSVFYLLFSVVFFVIRERASYGFAKMEPINVSIYDRSYWQVERVWKHSETFLRKLWLGTPFRSVINRWLGIRLGKMVFDDGVYISEKTLVEIGDYCNLNENSVLQAHSLEDGIYKSNYIKIGNCCTLEANAFVHYGVFAEDGVTITTDSFVMKGEHLSSQSIWGGNPAEFIQERKKISND